MEGKTLGTGTAQTLYLKHKKDKKNFKHLKSSKITEGPALSIVDHSIHIHTHPCYHLLFSLCCPLYKIDVVFTRKVDKKEETAALKVRVIFILGSSQQQTCRSLADPLFQPVTLMCSGSAFNVSSILLSPKYLLLFLYCCLMVWLLTTAAHLASSIV